MGGGGKGGFDSTYISNQGQGFGGGGSGGGYQIKNSYGKGGDGGTNGGLGGKPVKACQYCDPSPGIDGGISSGGSGNSRYGGTS